MRRREEAQSGRQRPVLLTLLCFTQGFTSSSPGVHSSIPDWNDNASYSVSLRIPNVTQQNVQPQKGGSSPRLASFGVDAARCRTLPIFSWFTASLVSFWVDGWGLPSWTAEASPRNSRSDGFGHQPLSRWSSGMGSWMSTESGFLCRLGESLSITCGSPLPHTLHELTPFLALRTARKSSRFGTPGLPSSLAPDIVRKCSGSLGTNSSWTLRLNLVDSSPAPSGFGS